MHIQLRTHSTSGYRKDLGVGSAMKFLINWLLARGDRIIAENRAEAERLWPSFHNVAADRVDWKEFYIRGCESPAEVSFLRSMMKEFDFAPDQGVLISPHLKMTLQVEKGEYRLDFLIDDWLIVEIDGATWHSSPEAIARDRRRDDYFVEQGYAVLRIPASIVFNEPDVAIHRVRDAHALGKPLTPVVPEITTPVAPEIKRLEVSDLFRLIQTKIEDANRYVTDAAERQQAARVNPDEYHAQLMAEKKVEAEKRRQKIDEQFPPGSPERQSYDESYRRIKAKMEERKKQL